MPQASPLSPARRRAQDLAASGDLAGARAILEKAVELGKANLSEDDPDLLQTAHQLGQLYQRLDDPSAARRVLEEAYAAGQLRLGDHDPLMVEISSEIGVVAEELGNRHEARKAFTRVAEYGPAALGATHEAVARAQAYLGHTPDSVRPAAPPTAAPAVPVNPPETHLTLVTPVPSGSPFGAGAPAAPFQTVPRALVQPPPPIEPVWTPPSPRSPDGVDEPTVMHPIITPQGTASAPVQVPPTDQASAAYGTRLPPPPADERNQFRRPSAPATPPPSAPGFDRAGQRFPVQRPVDQQWAPPPPHHHLIGAAGPTAGTALAGVASSGGDDAYRKRGLGIFAAIAAVLASLIAVAALVFVLASRDNNPAPASNVPTLAGRAPSGLMLHDLGSEVDLTWTDPSPGQVSFIVVMAHPGEELKPMSTLGPGTTSYRAGGLSTKLNYCFAVAAVYSAKTFATSPQSCTSRGSAATASSTGK